MPESIKELVYPILKEELIPALGCTEPIAIAYACAKAKEVLGAFPEKMTVRCSGNIVKNVKGVVVPNTVNLKGIKTAALMGVVCGDASKGLQVIAGSTAQDVARVKELLHSDLCRVELIEGEENLQIWAILEQADNCVQLQIQREHTNITKIIKNGEVLLDKDDCSNQSSSTIDRSKLSVESIVHYVETEDLTDILPLLKKQVECNMAIAEEGLKNPFGSQVGRIMMQNNPNDLFTKVIAYAASGSDARMSGCNLPVVVNSGSGNQGMTCSVPVVVYAREKDVSEERMFQALALSNLITVHLKTGIGRLSAYCGAVSAACGAFSAITWLAGGNLRQIEMTITNLAGTISGMICDGAKPSCASKIASALSCGVIAHQMALNYIAFEEDTGIIKHDIEQTIDAVGKLSRDGMRITDQVILNMMISDE
ncbi:serine dehydratase subunit alpha family protein [Holdemania massiliensis]|uniref:L-cysteine desulfidase family protein n=1 Tax=Holdemania massiliensis TaxID=1468449 RepID=UPI001F052DC3|nr:L-serine ammonia-lyase, iron-sulfur-dependent, subunit alpha [Holdemania massiliensis]MCH1940354.1 L-serine ammonia-lyase, iron-sulfur-dependent, subunit alpha [Holdemania massiliensis]